MKQVFKSLIGIVIIYVIVNILAVTLTMSQFLPIMAYSVAFIVCFNFLVLISFTIYTNTHQTIFLVVYFNSFQLTINFRYIIHLNSSHCN